MIHWGIITNPCAKRTKTPAAIKKLEEIASGHRTSFRTAPISNPLTPQNIINSYSKTIEELLKDGIDALLVNSGDTGHLYVNSALAQIGKLSTLPQLNLRAGTVNILGELSNIPYRSFLERHFGKGSTSNGHVLRTVLNRYKDCNSLETININLLKVNTDEARFIAFALGAGIIRNFFERYEKAGANHTVAVYEIFKATLQVITSPLSRIDPLADLKKPSKLELEIDWKKQDPKSYFGIIISAIDITMDFGPFTIAFEPLSKTTERADFKIGYSSNIPLYQLTLNIPRFIRVKPFSTPQPLWLPSLKTQNSNQVKIIPEENLDYILDGELLSTKYPITITPSQTLPYILI